jgi:hypothetical protein
MQIGQVHLSGHSARLAHSAWPSGAVRALAEKEASEPERQLLLAYTARPLEQKTRGQCVSRECALEALAKSGVAVQRQKGHLFKIPDGLQSQKTPHRGAGGLAVAD